MQAMVAGHNALQQVKKLPTHSYSAKHCKQLWSEVCNSHTNFSRVYGVSAIPSAQYSTTPVTADRRTTDIDPEASMPQTTIDTMNQLGTSSRWNRKTKRRGRIEATSAYSASAYTASDHPAHIATDAQYSTVVCYSAFYSSRRCTAHWRALTS